MIQTADSRYLCLFAVSLAFCLFGSTAAAQFTFVSASVNNFDGVYTSSIAFADVDGDKDQDVLITGLGSEIRKIGEIEFIVGVPVSTLYLNPASGHFILKGGDNVYEVEVTASDGTNSAVQAVYYGFHLTGGFRGLLTVVFTFPEFLAGCLLRFSPSRSF